MAVSALREIPVPPTWKPRLEREAEARLQVTSEVAVGFALSPFPTEKAAGVGVSTAPKAV
jgi:hypothetical protein